MATENKEDLYETLGITKEDRQQWKQENKSEDDISKVIEKNWKDLIKKWHPDKNLGNEKEASQKTQEINNAHDVLKTPEGRKQYDASQLQKIQQQPTMDNKPNTTQTASNAPQPQKATNAAPSAGASPKGGGSGVSMSIPTPKPQPKPKPTEQQEEKVEEDDPYMKAIKQILLLIYGSQFKPNEVPKKPQNFHADMDLNKIKDEFDKFAKQKCGENNPKDKGYSAVIKEGVLTLAFPEAKIAGEFMKKMKDEKLIKDPNKISMDQKSDMKQKPEDAYKPSTPFDGMKNMGKTPELKKK